MRLRNIPVVTLLSVLCFAGSLLAQQPPAGLNWFKINTPHVRIVYHEDLQDQALQLASMMDHISKNVTSPYAVQPRPIRLYLSSLTLTPNAFVALAPRHMHFYTHPPQNVAILGNAPWLKLLAVHEYRHAVQFDNLDQNLYQIPSALAGDFGRSIMAFLTVPMWYYEGDAISAETAYTVQGRGRMPEFAMPLKAIINTSQKFSYNQAYLQSYRRFYPNHYYLGYYMHTHVARNYGMETWPTVIDRTSRMQGFNRSLRRTTGFNLNRTYKNMVAELQTEWEEDTKPIPDFLIPVSLKSNPVYTSYRYGHRMDDGSVISAKMGLATAPMIVRTDTLGNETRLRGLNQDPAISSNGTHLTWSTQVNDIRWGLQDFSDIMVMEAQTGNIQKITSRQQFLSPTISPSGDKIAAVRYSREMVSSIVVLDAADGDVLYEKAFDPQWIPRRPAWREDGKGIVFTLTSDNEVNISILEPETGTLAHFPFRTEDNISSVLYKGDYIYFISAADGTNALHALLPATGQRFQVLTGGYGYFNPTSTAGSSEIMIEAYTPQGYRLYTFTPDPNKFEAFKNYPTRHFYISPVLAQTGQENLFENFTPDISSYEIKRYRHLSDGLMLHSWLVLPAQNGVSGTVFVNDPLSVHSLSATLEYNQNERTTNQSLNYVWAGIYPVIGISALNGRRTSSQRDTVNSNEYNSYQWNEQSVSAQITLPFNFTREDFIQTLNISSSADYTFISGLAEQYTERFSNNNGTFAAAGGNISYLGFRQMSQRDFYPRLGLAMNASYTQTLPHGDFDGSLFSLSATGYLPGLFPHHSLRINGSHEEQGYVNHLTTGYAFSSRVRNFRGYENVIYGKTSKVSVDYALPVAYPDFALGRLIYCKRIRTNVFYDHGIAQSWGNDYTLSSFGVDLIFDINLFRILAEMDLGVSWIRTREGNDQLEFLLFQRF